MSKHGKTKHSRDGRRARLNEMLKAERRGMGSPFATWEWELASFHVCHCGPH